MHTASSLQRVLVGAAVSTACLLAVPVANAATIAISSRDAPGVGFNDPTPVVAVGGNTGTTLGQQRLNVFRHVAEWRQRSEDTGIGNENVEPLPTLVQRRSELIDAVTLFQIELQQRCVPA